MPANTAHSTDFHYAHQCSSTAATSKDSQSVVVRRGALAGGGRGKDYPWAGLQGLQTALRMTIQKEDDDGHRKGIPAKDISLKSIAVRRWLTFQEVQQSTEQFSR